MNQRRFPRISARCDVKLRQNGGETTLSTSAVTENVGMGGICILLDRGMDIFSSVELELHLDDGKNPMKMQGTIVWVVLRRDINKKKPTFDTGIEFSNLSADDGARLEAMLDKLESRPRR